jgi:WD40 repeat protein
MENPFPGPQPYRASDQGRFFGREDMAKSLLANVLSNRCVTVYGPSGAGKSSLMQAAVVPELIASHGVRVVRVDGWPEGEDPTRWLASAMYADLGLGEVPADCGPGEAIAKAAQRAARRSSRLLLVYLDQIEQLLHPSRPAAEVDAFFGHLQTLVDLPLRNGRVALSLREDYLGRFRDRLRDRGRLLENGFRVGPLTVAELSDAVCRAAASGDPPQTWQPGPMRALMLQVRVPGEADTDAAEAQAAYAQIVCRALFQERAAPERGARRPSLFDATWTTIVVSDLPEDLPPADAAVTMKAELILRRYLEAMLDDLGPLAPDARRLLEDHLVTADASRTLRTEKELLRILPEEKLHPILEALEGAAILHAEAHQGSRYFEIGHDWLARKVYEQRQQRERAEEDRRRAEEQEEERRLQGILTEERLAKARAQRRFLGGVTLASLVVAAGAAGMSVWAVRQRERAVEAGLAAGRAEHEATRRAVEASDARLLAGFRELAHRDELAWALKLLPEVQRPSAARGWTALASEGLRTSMLERTLHGDREPLVAAWWSPDGERILIASTDGKARLVRADGTEQPVVLPGHDKPITVAAFRKDGRRVLTASEDGTVRLWSADGTGSPVVLDGHAGPVVSAAFGPDGESVVVASRDDAVARVWSADGRGPVELRGHAGALTCVAWSPDGGRVLTASEDGTARVWSARGGAALKVFEGHKEGVLFVAPSPDGTRVLTTSRDGTARVWDASGKGKPMVLEGHAGPVVHAAWSPDGTRVATASIDKSARVWSADGAGDPVVLKGHGGAVTFVAFRPDGRYVATASTDRTARVWPVEGGTPLILRGHDGPVRSATFRPDGSLVLTAAGAREKGARTGDATARLWRTTLLPSLPRARRGFFHMASIGRSGKLVVAAYDDGKARLWPVDGTGSLVVLEGHKDWIAAAALSRDEKRIATASFDGTARLWSAAGAFEGELAGHTRPVRDVAWSADGAHVVTASDDMTARVWSAGAKGDPAVLRGHTDALTSAAWSPDDRRIVTTSLDDTARIWRADGTFERELRGHGDDVLGAAWSPDGARLVTASEDGTAQIWDASSGAPLVMLEHQSPVLSATWSPDGARVATSSADGKLRVWRADGRGEPVELEARAPALALAFLDGGKAILAVGADDTLSTWTLDTDALMAGLPIASADCLPAEMRATYFAETLDEARKHSADCEAGHPDHAARAPEPQGPSDDGVQAPRGPKAKAAADRRSSPGERRVAAFVLPGDAAVEVDGKPVRRRNGVVEVVLAAGGEKLLKASMGTTLTKVAEKSVILQEASPKTTVVDLNDKPASAAAKAVGKPARFGFDD